MIIFSLSFRYDYFSLFEKTKNKRHYLQSRRAAPDEA